jgi:transcriptional regulator with XRE-family HTH domain
MSAMDADPGLRRRVGARIRRARHDRDLSQTALARLIDDTAVSGSYISRWERGENMPSWTNLQAVADALDVTVAWLVAENDDDGPAARAA